jgi:predicted RNase H-like HicB family nuclease
MRLAGNIARDGKFWLIEVPILDVFTQGRTKREAFKMIADAIETLVNKDSFKIDVYPRDGSYFEISSNDKAILTAFLLKRQRIRHGVTLEEAARRMGVKSVNAYARYEKGESIPTMSKFNALWHAVSPDLDFVLSECA